MKIKVDVLTVTEVEIEIPETCECGADLTEPNSMRAIGYVGSSQDCHIDSASTIDWDSEYDDTAECSFTENFECLSCGRDFKAPPLPRKAELHISFTNAEGSQGMHRQVVAVVDGVYQTQVPLALAYRMVSVFKGDTQAELIAAIEVAEESERVRERYVAEVTAEHARQLETRS